MKPNHLYAASALLTLALNAWAQDPEEAPPPLQEPDEPTHQELHPDTHDPQLEDSDVMHESFRAADTDADGMLSLAEAQVALPEFAVEDVDTDGIVSQAEAEAALPELKFQQYGHPGGDAPVTQAEFGMIVVALNERAAEEDALAE